MSSIAMDAQDHIELIVERVARQLRDQSLTISVAESLTGGMLTSYLAAGPGASTWLEVASWRTQRRSNSWSSTWTTYPS